MKKRNLFFAAAAAAGLVYSAVEGKGVFNKIRFKDVHEAVSSYVTSHYPRAFYSPISATEKGYVTTINNGTEKYILYITRTTDGVFVFNEVKA